MTAVTHYPADRFCEALFETFMGLCLRLPQSRNCLVQDL